MAAPMGHLTIKFNSNIFDNLRFLFRKRIDRQIGRKKKETLFSVSDKNRTNSLLFYLKKKQVSRFTKTRSDHFIFSFISQAGKPLLYRDSQSGLSASISIQSKQFSHTTPATQTLLKSWHCRCYPNHEQVYLY